MLRGGHVARGRALPSTGSPDRRAADRCATTALSVACRWLCVGISMSPPASVCSCRRAGGTGGMIR
eukprot:7390811-Prymnesium_polylepis.1